MATPSTLTFAALKKSIASGVVAPVYLLHGEEGFFTDVLVKQFEALVPEDVRDFNLFTLYAPQVDPSTVVEACQRYPMMADRQVVICKEAQSQSAAFLNALAPYAASPSPSTVLVIVCRGAQAKCAELTKKMKEGGGVVFESKKVYDSQLGAIIRDFVKEKGLNVEERALAMLQEYVGSDLSRIYNEVDKLTVVLGPGATITPESIERNIGFSKDYNNFELVHAIAVRDDAKAMKIVDYFSRNPKNNPAIVTATVLFTLFSNVLIAFYSSDRSDHGLMEQLGFRFPRQLTDVKAAMQRYKPWQVIQVIDAIRRFDAEAKGIGSRGDQYDLLRQLVFKILTCTGNVKF
jgi:DNA polymerase-3 subunit delta